MCPLDRSLTRCLSSVCVQWALLNFLVPSLFGSSEDFAEWFNVEDPAQRGEIVARLHRLLRPFLLRRLKSEVEKALLPKIETKLFVGMSAMQRAWYKKILERDIEVLNATNTSKVRLLNIVMQLRKVCNHPYLFTSGAKHTRILRARALMIRFDGSFHCSLSLLFSLSVRLPPPVAPSPARRSSRESTSSKTRPRWCCWISCSRSCRQQGTASSSSRR